VAGCFPFRIKVLRLICNSSNLVQPRGAFRLGDADGRHNSFLARELLSSNPVATFATSD
jgi:hypothetical protein